MPAQTEPLPPNPPPTYGDSTRTFPSGTPNRLARCLRRKAMLWVLSCTVSSSPFQTAVVACGSIALWFRAGVLNVRSTETGAAASAASASPFSAPCCMIGLPLTGTAFGASAAKSTAAGSSSYADRTSRAACLAVSCVSATTTATGWPFQCTWSVAR
ncbi:hypothetical protein GCM10020001_036550 [Nonomuraea salmonea]